MERSRGRDGFPAGRHLAVISTSARSTARVGEEALLDAAVRQAMQAGLKDDVYAELLVGSAPNTMTAGAVEPVITVRFPTYFAGLPG